MTSFPNGHEPPRLSPGFFTYPKVWRFNSADFLVFYYALGALISLLMILLLLGVLVSQRQVTTQQPPPSTVPTQAATNSPAVGTALPVAIPSLSPSPALSSSPSPVAAPNARMLSAETQPSYALKATAFEQLSSDPELSKLEQAQALRAFQKYQKLATQAQNRLELALEGIQKEHYTVSIRQLKRLVDSGPILGDVYLQAKVELPKAHLKKIDYYLIQGNLSAARRALTEAKNQINPSTLQDYDQKIKSLEKVSR